MVAVTRIGIAPQAPGPGWHRASLPALPRVEPCRAADWRVLSPLRAPGGASTLQVGPQERPAGLRVEGQLVPPEDAHHVCPPLAGPPPRPRPGRPSLTCSPVSLGAQPRAPAWSPLQRLGTEGRGSAHLHSQARRPRRPSPSGSQSTPDPVHAHPHVSAHSVPRGALLCSHQPSGLVLFPVTQSRGEQPLPQIQRPLGLPGSVPGRGPWGHGARSLPEPASQFLCGQSGEGAPEGPRSPGPGCWARLAVGASVPLSTGPQDRGSQSCRGACGWGAGGRGRVSVGELAKDPRDTKGPRVNGSGRRQSPVPA